MVLIYSLLNIRYRSLSSPNTSSICHHQMPPVVLLPAGYGRVGKGSEYIMVTRSTWKCLLFLVARFTSQLWVDAFPARFTSVRRSDDCLFRKYSDSGGAEVDFDKPHQPKNHSTSYPAIGVTLKMAFDSSPVWGVADLSETKSERFTSPASLELVHRLRRLSDCVLVGKGTLDRDNCTLTVRRVPLTKDRPRQPIRVVLDPALTLVKNHPQRKYEIFQDGLATIVYYSSSSVFHDTYNFLTKECEIKREQEAYTAKIWNENVTLIDASVLEVKSSHVESRRYISPKQILQDLATRGVHHIMVEGGETLN
jgi:riboflavin biosynthesis pyrimidine reductase